MPQYKHIDVDILRIKGEPAATQRFVEELVASVVPVGGFKCIRPGFNEPKHGQSHGPIGHMLPPSFNNQFHNESHHGHHDKHPVRPRPEPIQSGCINYILSKIEPCPVQYPVWIEPIGDNTKPENSGCHCTEHHEHTKPEPSKPHCECYFNIEYLDKGIYKLMSIIRSKPDDVEPEKLASEFYVWLDIRSREMVLSSDKNGFKHRESFDIVKLKSMHAKDAVRQLVSAFESIFEYRPHGFDIRMDSCKVIIKTSWLDDDSGDTFDYVYTFCDEIGPEYK